jgi:hypothetical protein
MEHEVKNSGELASAFGNNYPGLNAIPATPRKSTTSKTQIFQTTFK